jgi:glycosyltransferase involved in cell wall biosynthesis
MRISLLNLNLIGEDAIGSCIVSQVRFFQRRGDDVRVYVVYPPERVPPEVSAVTSVVTLRELIEGRQEHFRLSDIYIYHYPGRYLLLESIRGIERGIVIFYYHNVTPPELWGSDVGRELLRQGIEGGAMVHYADFCIADSPFDKQDLVDRHGYPPNRIHVLPLAVELEHLTPGARDPELVRRYGLQGKQVLLFVGRMAGNKRIDLLVEALAQVKKRMPETKLMLVGDDHTNPAFREVVGAAQSRAVELGVIEDVIWTGRVGELLPYYRLADVYVTASLHEGFGLPLVQAMACGVPVVASRAGAMPWVLGDAGLLCDAGSSDDLAAKVTRVLREGETREALVERGLSRAAAFSIGHYEKRLGELVDPAATGISSAATPAPDQQMGRMEMLNRARVDPFREQLVLKTLAGEILGQSDIALRDYLVRSGVPVLGSLIVWVRQTLTSHLREPYLDPVIERQVAFNRLVAEWVRRITQASDASLRRQADLESRLETLEAQIDALRRSPSGGGHAKEC